MDAPFTPASRKMTADWLIALAIMLGGCALFLYPVVIELVYWMK